MFRSPLVPIFLVVAVDVLALTLVLPLLPYYAEHFGATPFVVGTLFASFALCQFIAGPILGRISDRVGRKPTLVVSQIGTFIGFLILGFAGSLWMIFLARIIDGLTAGNLSIAQAYISDVTKPEERTKAFGLIGIAFGGGFLLGPAISGFLSRYGYQWPAFAAAFLSLVSIICSIVLLPKVARVVDTRERIGRLKGFTQFLTRPRSRRRLLEFFFFTLSFSTMIGGLALFLERRMGFNAEHTGYVFAFSGLVGGLIQGGLLGRLVKRFGEERLSIIGFGAMALGAALIGTIFGLPTLSMVVIISGIGSAITRPSVTTLITKSVEPYEQGAALGVSQSLASIAQMIGPLVAGYLIQHEQLGLYGIVSGTFALIGAAVALRHEREDTEASANQV